MKFCYGCGHTTPGQPFFCNHCGLSYEFKVCPRMHQNPRWAEACSRCGSRNLSTPQPRVPWHWRVIGVAIFVATGVPLLVASIGFLLGLGSLHLLGKPLSFVAAVQILLIGALWGLWSTLPHVLRATIVRLLRRRRYRDRV